MATEAKSAADASSAISSIDTSSGAFTNSVHQRLRANSTIMQVKKLLGTFHKSAMASMSL